MNIFNENYHINMITSGKDIYINFNKWRNEEINKLLIIGLSGSGKSTLSRKLAKNYDCAYIDLDKFRGNVWYTDEQLKEIAPYIWYYYNNVWDKGDRHNIKNMDPDERKMEADKFLLWLINHPDKMIIEGGLLDRLLWNNEIIRKNYPIIFKGTSMLKSMARMSYREFTREHPGDRDFVDNLLWWMKWCTRYKKMTDQNNNLRDKIINDIDKNNYEELEEDYE